MEETFGERHRLIPACRYGFLLVSIACLLLSLSAAEGCCKRCAGVTVTKEVPYSKETIPEIKARETTNPLPARGDTAIHSHKIPRAGNDNGMSIPPGDDHTVK